MRFQDHFAKTIAIIRPQLARAFAWQRLDVDGKRKGNEDGGSFAICLKRCLGSAMRGLSENIILRKEVIQPQVPLRLPCYDFTPVADPTVAGCLPFGLAHRLRVEPTPMV